MTSEWLYNCSIAAQAGHLPLTNLVPKPRWRVTVSSVLKTLKEQNVYLPVSFHIENANRATDQFLQAIDGSDQRFAPWTSFFFGERVYFVFTTKADAAKFSLLWPSHLTADD